MYEDVCAMLSEDQLIQRFRPNFIVDNVPPFAEDQWDSLRIGDINFVVSLLAIQYTVT